jgi:glycosyltransferase involved in cell wall biosynthesis
MVHGNLAAAFGGVITGTPVFWGVRHSRLDVLVEKRSTVLLERLLALLSRIPRRIVYNSRSGKTRHESLGYMARRGIVVPNGFDLDRFKPDEVFRSEVRRELGIGADCVVVGFFGRFHPMKDHATLLEAVKMLRPDIPQLKVILAGDGCGPGNPELRKMIADRNLADTVLLLGPRRDVERLTAAIDIAANSSRANEGFANVIGEAMAVGVPCVVTDVGDAASIVADNGEIVPPSNARAFSDALHRMIMLGSDGRREMGARARKRIEESFSIDAITRQFEVLYSGGL